MSRSLLQQCGDAATLVLLEWRHTGRGESGEWLYKTKQNCVGKYMSLRREQLAAAHEASSAPRSLRIIVADDDRDTVLTLVLLLREEGHEVRGVHSAIQVLRVVNELNPDVVVLDIAMPELSGWQVARKIRERPARRPMLIGISGEYKHSVDRILSEVVGFDHYLVKPYEPAALMALLEPLRYPQAET